MLNIDGDDADEGDLKEIAAVLKGYPWPNVMLPHGWDDTKRLFNFSGFGTILVGPDGIVRGVDLEAEKELPKALKALQPAKP